MKSDDSKKQILDSITTIQGELQEGKYRLLANTDRPLLAWFPEWLSPNGIDIILSGYGISKNEGAALNQYEQRIIDDVREEVEKLYEAIENAGVDIPMAEWQRAGIGRKLHESLNRRAAAICLWEGIGVPLRVRRGRIYRVCELAPV